MKQIFIIAALAFSIGISAQSTFENVYDGGGGSETAFAMDTAGDGKIIICGSFDPDNDGNTFASIVMQGPDGTRDWSYTYGSTRPSGLTSVVQCAGGFAATGYAYNSETQMNDVMYLRIDASGMLLAGPYYYGFGNQSANANSIIECSDGDFAICGRVDRRQLLMRISSDALSWIRTWGSNEYPYLNTSFETIELPSTDLIVLGETNEFQTVPTNYDPANYNICLTQFTSSGTLDSMASYSIDGHFASSGYDFARRNDMLYIVGQTTSEFSPTICIHGFIFQVDTAFMGIEIKEFWKTPGPVVTKISTCTGMGIAYNAARDEFALSGYILDDTSTPQYNAFLCVVSPVMVVNAFNVFGNAAGNQFFTDVLSVGDSVYGVGVDWDDMGSFGTPADWYSIKTRMNLRSCNEVRTPITYEKPRFTRIINLIEPFVPEPTSYRDEAYHDAGQVRQLCYAEPEQFQSRGSSVKITTVLNTLGVTVYTANGAVSSAELQLLPIGIYIVMEEMNDGSIRSEKRLICPVR